MPPSTLCACSYVFGMVRFLLGYHRTNFAQNKKMMLALMYPVLLVTSDRFRQQFNQAVSS